MRFHLLVAAAALSLTRCTFDATGLSAESTGDPSTTTTGDESTGPATTIEPTTGEPTTADPENCGNSQLDDGEECDNGELNNGKDGSICKGDCTNNFCGDKYVASNESCDDGNMVDGDGCDSCKLPGCGNGMVDPGEDCDDKNDVDGDDCSNACTKPFCGDNNINTGEVCDDGSGNNNEQACRLDCMPNVCGDTFVLMGVESCDDGNMDETDGCLSDCTLATCGDTVVQPPEECDDGDPDDTNACTTACKLPTCGDTIVSPSAGEECDLGGGMNVDNGACTATCKAAKCQDGLKWEGIEECDDMNMTDNDGCTNACKLPVCHDMIVQAGEECDDGPNSDTCVECKKTCGNGVKDGSEQCDDGNLDNDDTCSATCQQAAYLVFVTSQKFAADFGGKSEADDNCNELAMAANLPGAGGYKAWISDSNDDPVENLFKSELPYIRPDKKKIADSWAKLLTDALQNPIAQTETKQVLNGGGIDCGNGEKLVWTSTLQNGTAGPGPHCNDWKDTQMMTKGGAGNLLATDKKWTETCQAGCNITARLYCFQQP